MSMISSPSPPTTSSFPTASPGLVIPSPSTIARRGRRPALIPYSTELSAYISATSSANPSFHISPFGTILGTTFNPPLSTNVGRAPLFVLPPLPPDDGHYNPRKTMWRAKGESGNMSPFGWGSEDEGSDREFELVTKEGRKRAMTTGTGGRKARLRRSFLMGQININVSDMDIDIMDVDDEKRKEVEGDAFTWVNSSSPIDESSKTLPKFASLTRRNPPTTLTKDYLEPSGSWGLNTDDEESSGVCTVPTSPLSATFGPDFELQRTRLQEAGLGIESVVSARLVSANIERFERKI